MDEIDRHAKALDDTRPHDPLVCGRAPETDCPACLVKYLPGRILANVEAELQLLHIDPADLSNVIWRYIETRLDEHIRELCREPLRIVQLELWDFFEDPANRDELRNQLRDILVDDIIAIAEAVYETKRSGRRKVSKAYGRIADAITDSRQRCGRGEGKRQD